jgi:hypothetical protein
MGLWSVCHGLRSEWLCIACRLRVLLALVSARYLCTVHGRLCSFSWIMGWTTYVKRQTENISKSKLKFSIIYPLHARHPHKPQPAEPPILEPPKKNKKKRESQFQRIDHRTRPISCGGSNQREPPVLLDSPSPCASADTLFLPTSRAPEEQRQSRRNHSRGNALPRERRVTAR